VRVLRYFGGWNPWRRRAEMKKSRFTEEQIVGMLKESEAGQPTAELCRKHGVSA
jgi:hypothetical protein